MKQNDISSLNKLSPQSYENIFNVYQDNDGYYYYNLFRTINFPVDLDSNTYSMYVTQHKDTWPLISWKAYKNVKLWWVICAANQIINPVEQPKPGTNLKIIGINIIRNLLNSLRNE